MKKINKASLVIAPMALMLFSSSLNIPKVMADDNGSWSDQEQINQQNKHNQELIDKYKNYTNNELYEFLSDVEKQIPNIIDIANKDYENDYKRMYNNDRYSNLIKQIENINDNNRLFTENDLNCFNQFDNSFNINKDFDQKLKETFNMILQNNQENIKQNIMALKKESLDFLYKIVNENNNKINNLNNITKNESKKYLEYKSSALEKSNYLKNKISNNKDIISIKDIQDLQNVISDLHFVRDNIISYQYVKYDKNIENDLDDLSSYLNLIYNQSENESSKSSISLDDEIANLKNQINSINNKSNNSYIPVSNNSNINNNDSLKNDLNNAKNNIDNIINKNIELSNTTNSLKNEIETLKQQVHDLNNNKKSKHKKNKANKRALNQKRKELNRVNKELKKHIRKSNKKKLIQKRNYILKSIKKLNK